MRDGDGAEADADRGGGQVDLGNRDARHSEAVDGDVGAELGADRGNVDGGDNDGAQSAGEGEVQERRLGKHGGAVGEAEQALVVAPPQDAVAVVTGDEGAGVDVAGVGHPGVDVTGVQPTRVDTARVETARIGLPRVETAGVVATRGCAGRPPAGPWAAGHLPGLGSVGSGQRHDRRPGRRRPGPAGS